MYKDGDIMKEKYDVIIIGGGIAGISAAITLKRHNKSVLLVEKQCILGGLATSGLINWYEPLCNGKGKQLIFGVAEELLKLAAEYGATLDKNWLENGKGEGRYATFFNHNIFATALTCKLNELGVDLYFDTLFTDVIITENRIKAVKLQTIEKEEIITCKYVIDATGTAKVFDTCNLPLRKGSNYLSFYIHKAGNINSDQYLRNWEIFGSNMVGDGQPKDVSMLVGDNANDINTYIIKSHEIFYKELKEKNKGIDVTSIPHMPQFRMIRSIVGEKTIDDSYKNKHYFDSITTFGYFAEPGNTFELPYGSLYNKKIGNLFAVGRIISSSNQGWDAIRVIPVAALTGEVVANAINMLNGKANYELDILKFKEMYYKA